MDTEHFARRWYRPSFMVAILLSLTVVVVTSLIARSMLNLRGALVLEEPRNPTVITLVEPKLAQDVVIREIKFLRKEEAKPGEKPTYTYHVRTSDNSDYFVRLVFDTTQYRWALERFERLHGGNSAPPTLQN